ncbi:hypothetical protein Tco_0103940 [Tanacetum coccineum]
MANLKYSDKHNMVAFLKKPNESVGFITEYVIFPKASIDSKEYTITEASVRSKLQLADATGIHNLSDAEIYAGLATLGYVTEGAAMDQGEGSAQPTESHPTPVDPLPSDIFSSPHLIHHIINHPPHSPMLHTRRVDCDFAWSNGDSRLQVNRNFIDDLFLPRSDFASTRCCYGDMFSMISFDVTWLGLVLVKFVVGGIGLAGDIVSFSDLGCLVLILLSGFLLPVLKSILEGVFYVAWWRIWEASKSVVL